MTIPCLQLSSVDCAGRRVLLREDFNVPLTAAGEIADDSRICRALPSIQQVLAQGGQVFIASHLGRPDPDAPLPRDSLEPVRARLSELLEQEVPLVTDWLEAPLPTDSSVVLLENVRLFPGELDNDPDLGAAMASLFDVFVMDAFAVAHRRHASTYAVARHSAISCAGPLLCEEISALSRAMQGAMPPVVAVVGGAKISTKIQLLEALLEKVTTLIVGGGMANTLLAASGQSVGRSLYEPDAILAAKQLLATAKQLNVHIPLPTDVVVAPSLSDTVDAQIKSVAAIQESEAIFDIGPKTTAQYVALLEVAGTIIWNGPVGVFEQPAFAEGTRRVAQAIADSSAYSIAGGGDTLASIAQFNLAEQISYLSTGGGAFLSYLQAETLPAIAMLIERRRETA